MIQTIIAGDKQSAQAFEVRVGGVEVPAKIAQIRIAGAVQTFWQAMTATASPTIVSGSSNSDFPTDVGTATATATPVGGTAPYTYLWTGGGAGWSINSPNSASTAFVRAGLNPGEGDSASFSCTVTDAAGITAATNSVDAYAQSVSFL